MEQKCVAAVDLGASSGRVILVTLQEDHLEPGGNPSFRERGNPCRRTILHGYPASFSGDLDRLEEAETGRAQDRSDWD